MNWTMPRPVLQVVAAVLALGALGAFTLGVINAPERGGRLPGQRPAGQAGGPAEAINATEATPLSQERIEGPPPAVAQLANKTDAAETAEAGDQAVNATPPATPAEPSASAVNATPASPAEELQAPPPEEPPH